MADETGAAIVTLLISREGKAISATIKQSSGFPRLDTASIAAAMSPACKFVPAVIDGQPTQTSADLKYTWRSEMPTSLASTVEARSGFEAIGSRNVVFWRKNLPDGVGHTVYVKNMLKRAIVIDSFELEDCVNVVNSCVNRSINLGLMPGQTSDVITVFAKDPSRPIYYLYQFSEHFASDEIRDATRTQEEVQLAFNLAYPRFASITNAYFKQFPDVSESTMVLNLVIAPNGRIVSCVMVSSDILSSDIKEQLLTNIRLTTIGSRDVPEYRIDNFTITFRP